MALPRDLKDLVENNQFEEINAYLTTNPNASGLGSDDKQVLLEWVLHNNTCSEPNMTKVVRALKNLDTNIDASGLYDITPLHQAVIDGREVAVRALVNNDANVFITSTTGRSILGSAKNAEMARFLLEHFAGLYGKIGETLWSVDYTGMIIIGLQSSARDVAEIAMENDSQSVMQLIGYDSAITTIIGLKEAISDDRVDKVSLLKAIDAHRSVLNGKDDGKSKERLDALVRLREKIEPAPKAAASMASRQDKPAGHGVNSTAGAPNATFFGTDVNQAQSSDSAIKEVRKPNLFQRVLRRK